MQRAVVIRVSSIPGLVLGTNGREKFAFLPTPKGWHGLRVEHGMATVIQVAQNILK